MTDAKSMEKASPDEISTATDVPEATTKPVWERRQMKDLERWDSQSEPELSDTENDGKMECEPESESGSEAETDSSVGSDDYDSYNYPVFKWPSRYICTDRQGEALWYVRESLAIQSVTSIYEFPGDPDKKAYMLAECIYAWFKMFPEETQVIFTWYYEAIQQCPQDYPLVQMHPLMQTLVKCAAILTKECFRGRENSLGPEEYRRSGIDDLWFLFRDQWDSFDPSSSRTKALQRERNKVTFLAHVARLGEMECDQFCATMIPGRVDEDTTTHFMTEDFFRSAGDVRRHSPEQWLLWKQLIRIRAESDVIMQRSPDTVCSLQNAYDKMGEIDAAIYAEHPEYPRADGADLAPVPSWHVSKEGVEEKEGKVTSTTSTTASRFMTAFLSAITRLVHLSVRGSGKMSIVDGSGTSAPASAASAPTPPGAQIATVAAGCFWGVEHAYRQHFKADGGLYDARVGFVGGDTTSPSYRSVCSGTTGHAEATRLVYDPARISYRQLVEFFYRMHDPTTPDQQGADRGSQYRSALFFHDAEQERIAREITAQANAQWWGGRIVSEILPAQQWWDAEEYHQLYLVKNPDGYQCSSHHVRPFPELK
ncbi:peptide methionine sulfoxide reductase [Grosmannia clavigera kw1407]|uniref:peptide-methionine (S)-S-oxide reductase n=1 Tax=Grosmannia clavigera (strain kw1407 / UAMH 11150) TaxID=655863 RepID=F0XMN8_GROCL|nr:peptide methionine sulfoxide reductase [Grosmannia clavigera kw1407]EFX01035.1 peptide methionine sulfoxide reductase [Grosmannia clavigera kw1407]